MEIVIPVIRELENLPYFPQHVMFLRHTGECGRCHAAVTHGFRQSYDWALCETGRDLRDLAWDAILEQRELSRQN